MPQSKLPKAAERTSSHAFTKLALRKRAKRAGRKLRFVTRNPPRTPIALPEISATRA